MPNLKFLPSTVPEIWRGSQNFKSKSRDDFTAPFDLIFSLSASDSPLFNLHAKLEVSSFNRSRDMQGIPKFYKVGHVTPSRTLLI